MYRDLEDFVKMVYKKNLLEIKNFIQQKNKCLPRFSAKIFCSPSYNVGWFFIKGNNSFKHDSIKLQYDFHEGKWLFQIQRNIHLSIDLSMFCWSRKCCTNHWIFLSCICALFYFQFHEHLFQEIFSFFFHKLMLVFYI
jgi:hypothetical protein